MWRGLPSEQCRQRLAAGCLHFFERIAEFSLRWRSPPKKPALVLHLLLRHAVARLRLTVRFHEDCLRIVLPQLREHPR